MGPIPLEGTTTLRAAAFKTDWMSTNVDTHTYIFVEDVITQSPNGEKPGPDWPGPRSGKSKGYIVFWVLSFWILHAVRRLAIWFLLPVKVQSILDFPRAVFFIA